MPEYVSVKDLTIIDNLTSDDERAALSAKQGKVLNGKINAAIGSGSGPVTPQPQNYMVNSMSGDETDKAPTVHAIKREFNTKVDLVGGKVPLSLLPDIQNTNANITLLGGKGIVVSKDDNTYIISRAPSKTDVINKLKDGKKVKLTSSLKYKDICYCDDLGIFIAVAEDSNKVAKSSNGKDWAEVTLPEALKYSSVCYSSKIGKICIVAKDSDKVVVSSDGVSFMAQTLPKKLDYVDVVAGDNVSTTGMFVVLSTSTSMMASTDGISWIEKTISAPVNGGTWNAITYNDKSKQLVVVGDKGAILMSKKIEDTSSIIFDDKKLDSNDVNLSDVCYSRSLDKYCAVVSNGSNKTYVYDCMSANNITKWKEVTLSSSSNWVKVRYIPFYKCFFAISGSENKGAVSLDGDTWEGINLPDIGVSTVKYSSIACSSKLGCVCMSINGADKFVVVGIDVPFVWSTIRWEEHTLPSNTSWSSICWSPELRLFCTVAYGNNKAATSPDGITWIERTLPSSTYWQSICWSPELRLFCAIANSSNKAATSPDGITWTQRTLPSNVDWRSICWSSELQLFCTIAQSSNKAATSSDGITWTQRTLPSSDGWFSVCWSSELRLFCAVTSGNSNKVATSPNGITWIERTLPSSAFWYSICWSPELQLFCTIAQSSNKAATSPDGITWTQRTLPSNSYWFSICWSSELRLFCAIDNSNKALFGIPE